MPLICYQLEETCEYYFLICDSSVCLKNQREVIEIIMPAPEYFYYALETRGWICPLRTVCPGAECIRKDIKALDSHCQGHQPQLRCSCNPRLLPVAPAELERAGAGRGDGGLPVPPRTSVQLHSPQTFLSQGLICSGRAAVRAEA